MAKPQYRVLALDTTVARTDAQIILSGEQFDGIRVISAPAGLVLSLNWYGSTDDTHYVPMVAGDSVRFLDDCEQPFKADEGLTIRHNAVAGTLLLYISQGVSP